ncbi:FKBP-type peptidyl-prolyl cis-trans isomerase [Pedobacter aquatilis]|uniref:FKBP-type peptidyl-prolyl cis-trans isomerase n=1 Tax=Pedobacter aquatilis TaxID=351343 RepID=UPI00292ED372|nr:FKBP-type peptidyl-prolyl cis-trans isomerase [Pedobacter aquatilis]
MIKIKHFLLLVCIAGCFAACKKADSSIDTYDAVAQFKADTTEIRAFVKKNNLTVLKNEQYGVFYQIIQPGSGNLVYSASTGINVEYEGRLLSGTVFDSSSGTPVSLTLGNLIPGWQIGIPYIQKGGVIRLLIPSYYGYGNIARNAPQSVIPANAPLDFTITLHDAAN